MSVPKSILLALAVTFIASVQSASQAAERAPATLKTFLEREGFGGAPLHRRFGNHLFVNTLIEGRRTALMIDSACPVTLIDRASAAKLGLAVRETKKSISSVTGRAQRYGVTALSTLVMGNCTFKNVSVEVADEHQINFIARPHLDGLFGANDMAKFGMIVDCARQMIYVNPKGASAATSQKLAQFLAGRGFSRIPMRFNVEHHLEIDALLNGHPLRLIVDTGSGFSLISAPAAMITGAAISPGTSYHGERIAHLKQLVLGNLVINNAEIAVGNVPRFVGAGLLGEEHLSWNFAIVDLGGMNLYLRQPEAAPAKKH